MPRLKTHLTPAEYAVLGLLRQRPAYGYELQRLLTGRRGLGRVCPVEPAMVYAILKSLSGLDLIDGEWDHSDYPPKAVYRTTAEGDAAFELWLNQPVSRMRDIRFSFLVKLYFLIEADVDRARRLIVEQSDICSAYAAELEEELSEVEPASFDAIALSSKLSAARLTHDWLIESRLSLESKRKESTA